jgi:uncharacterized DUF497 family protein
MPNWTSCPLPVPISARIAPRRRAAAHVERKRLAEGAGREGSSLHGQTFEWDAEKAATNLRKHRVSFEKACEVFFDPFLRLLNASANDERREAVLGLTEDWSLLFVVHVAHQGDTLRIISAARRHPRRGEPMSMNERIQKRLRKDRPMTTISIRLPEDVIEDLKLLAPEMGFSGYQPLIRAYIGQGLRKDLARLVESDQVKMKVVVESLRRHGIDEQVIAEAIAEARAKTA